MNMRKAVAAAFGAALLGAGTSAVVVGGPAHGQLDKNKTGSATSSQTAKGGSAEASVSDANGTIDAVVSASKVAGAHQGVGQISQNVHHKAKGGKANGTNHGSAKSGSQKFHIG